MSAVNRHHAIVESEAPAASLQLLWADEAATAVFAQQLAALAETQDAFVALHGDLGAGKTTLVRHLLRALGVQGRIKSPTYAVVEAYDLPSFKAWHFDFYRFSDPREWEDAGFRDLFASPGLKIAEWPQKAAGLLPPADLALHLHTQDETRRQVLAEAHTPKGAHMLQQLRAALPADMVILEGVR